MEFITDNFGLWLAIMLIIGFGVGWTKCGQR